MQTPDPQLRLPLRVPAKAVQRPLPEPLPDPTGVYRVVRPFAGAISWEEQELGWKPPLIPVGVRLTLKEGKPAGMYGLFNEAGGFVSLAFAHILATCLEKEAKYAQNS